ncbi:unnamed protein product [Echinostoma caproni]|uniref:F-actin-capping protein subunit beta n=1 Tax=Echinostoma caproni TaxID=27848 RepID=A0A3P8L6X2_9TREM|nr:unnamed protein product [Echinostoma caproni]
MTSTVMLWLQTQRDQAGYFNLGGSLTRFIERDGPLGEAGVPITTSHIANIGRMVEVTGLVISVYPNPGVF